MKTIVSNSAQRPETYECAGHAAIGAGRDCAVAAPLACGEPFKEPAADGFMLGGFTWRHVRQDASRPVVIINAATSVRCRHYSRFADYLFANGFDVITFDYRGIGESAPPQ